jgi:DNA modification methylase
LSRIETIGDATLYLGDCREILPTLGKVDAVVTDPPYGINYGGLLKGKGDGKGGADKNGWKDYGAPTWDQDRPDVGIFDLMRERSGNQIIWGGNYFTDYLPPSMQWLIWDKGQRDFSLADFEMAWSSQNSAARIIDFPRAKALQDGKEHPTQKPVEVMRWCISQLPSSAKTFLDPFMGSGTTGVAAVDLGRKFIGIEREPHYFEIALRRITEAYKQPRLFKEEAPQAVQLSILDAAS